MNTSGEQPGIDPGRIAYLIDGFLRDNLTETEHDELDAWIEASPENMRLFEELTDEENLQAAQAWFRKYEGNRERKRKRFQGIQKGISSGKVVALTWYLAAACTIGLCFGIYWFAIRETGGDGTTVAQQQADNLPAGDNAVLILADGRRVPLHTSTTNREAGFRIENGTITYTDKMAIDTGYNTVMVPSGQQFKIVLADGSTVWLNAGSTIRYAAAFGKGSRRVTLNGEAFFEVQHNPDKPFTVRSGEQEVTVLGTRFNVNAYRNEQPTTTLIQGSVSVSTGEQTRVLVPGQQSTIGMSGIGIKNVDVDEVIAWKEGLFLFRSATIESVASELQRWYGLDVEFRGKPNAHFNATIKRTESLQRVLQVLEGSGYVNFTLEGKKLIVQP